MMKKISITDITTERTITPYKRFIFGGYRNVFDTQLLLLLANVCSASFCVCSPVIICLPLMVNQTANGLNWKPCTS